MELAVPSYRGGNLMPMTSVTPQLHYYSMMLWSMLFANRSHYLYGYIALLAKLQMYFSKIRLSPPPPPFSPFYSSTQELKHDYKNVSKLRLVIVRALGMCQPRCSLEHTTATFFFVNYLVPVKFLLFSRDYYDFFFSSSAPIAQKQPCLPREANDISGSGARHCRNRAYPRYAGAPMYCSKEPDYFLFHAAFSIHSAVPRVGEQRKW